MTVQPTDTYCFNQFESINFEKVKSIAKERNVTPPAVLIYELGEAVKKLDMNKKLSKDRNSMIYFRDEVDIGIAVDVDGELRTAVVQNVTNKTIEAIKKDIDMLVEKSKAGRLTQSDTDMGSVCWSLTSIGKNACEFAVPVLPKYSTGIVSVGRMQDFGKSILIFNMCHATLTGVEGARVV